ncbi:uncharacterized protein EV154DRAFT_543952 [Mucor mucedo]|uniref:uncharacterized protein n=1 Tax=Mucor mucedo TaxID=29922 RepID=UPI00221F00E0|nr:uncharacterized protein EV154DRAFT_543952 [Mucor mucedo]KAI7890850.1 hypothetical protein EV154DRAFT_543952 [Mucor mucedo]
MPKLRKCHVEVLNDLVNFGTSFALSNSLISDIYHAHEQDQANYTSLRKHNIFDHTIALLRHNDVESFVQNIWASKIEGLTDKAVALLNIIRYTWISFHPTLKNGPLLSVIKSFLAVSKIVDFVECKWCETQFTSGKYLDYRKSDYTTNSVKYNDALDYFKLFNNMEVIIVEASSGKIQESTVHTIEDCLKLLVCGISSLRKEAILNKNSSIATFKKLKVFGLKSILNQVALSKLYFNNVTRWNSVEKRIATLPSSWDNIIILVKYLELIATIFDDICDTHHLLQKLMEENLGLNSADSRSLKSMFEEQINVRMSSL